LRVNFLNWRFLAVFSLVLAVAKRDSGSTKEIAMHNHKFLKFTLVLAALFLLWTSPQPLAAALTWISDLDAVTNSIRSFGIWGPAVLFVLFVLQVFFAFIPGQALMVASGYLYGFSGGMFITWISLVFGGQAAFMLARRHGRPFAER